MSAPVIANLTLTITQFHPIGSLEGNIQYQMTLVPSSVPPPDGITFSLSSGNILSITAPKDFSGDVQLTYTLTDPDHLLIGVGFNAIDTALTSAGVATFPTITFARSMVLSSWQTNMVVLDTLAGGALKIYSYYIIVQEVSTASLGLIDPVIVNEPR